MKEYLTTNGRLSRSQYWLFAGVVLVLFFLLGGISTVFKSESVNMFIGFMVLIMLLISLFVKIKRWHDLNYSGFMVLINIIPGIGPLISFICLGFIKGTTGPNKYGDDPLEVSKGS